jgi:hypothetical protein
VTAEDGTTTQDWQVNVSIALNDATEILSFTLPEQTGPGNIYSNIHLVIIEVADGTNLTSLTPAFTLSEGATSVPASGTASDFSNAVTITVTAEDGTTAQDWIVKVSVFGTVSEETDIYTFTMPEETGPATIDITNHTVDIEVVHGTNLTSLTPTFTLSTGATSVPASGTASDYSSEVTITVTAEDGTTTQDWKVNVSEAPNDETDILTFTLTEETGPATINSTNHTVTIEVADGTNLTSLTPTFTLSTGATSVPASGTASDYSSEVTITVTAEDGITTQDWKVNVSEALNDETDILTFTFTEETGPATVDPVNHTIDIEVENGTDQTSLTPTFTLSDGATSVPASGTASDYSSEVTITVTAEDATTTQDWIVNVSEIVGVDDPFALNLKIQVYPNPANNILYIDSEERISRIVVYSIKGEIIKEISQLEISMINVSDLKSGVYILSLFNENEFLVSKRLIKE